VRYRERRNVRGSIVPKRVSRQLGPVTTRGKRPPADIVREAERHMAEVNSGVLVAERIVTVGDFVELQSHRLDCRDTRILYASRVLVGHPIN
jgi:hypothetical protein